MTRPVPRGAPPGIASGPVRVNHAAMTDRDASAPIDHRRQFALTLAFNTGIALFCVASYDVPLGWSLYASQLIGLGILFSSWAAIALWPGLSRLAVAVIAIPAGAGGAMAVMALTGSGPVPDRLMEQPRALLSMAVGGLVFGAAVSFYFHATDRIRDGEARLRQELLERVLGEQRLTEANLKLLQAQIEPHFLFNTLSNVLHLIDEKPADARRMLENLTAYLRASLRRTRAGPTTLGEELELVRAYLEIQAVRLGDRLRWDIQAAPELRHLELPPLLLQPLVENAVRHGLEPKREGGSVSVRASSQDGRLRLEVIDTGLGLSETSPPGVGLANVRARVSSVSGGRGELVLRPNRPAGLSVSIALPLAAAAAAPAAVS